MKAPTLETMVDRLRNTYAQSSEAVRQEGRAWYPIARLTCLKIANRTNRPVEHVIYALAALSPAQPWKANIKMTRDIAARTTFSNPGTFTKFARKAWRCMAGDLDALSGPKVMAFALAVGGDLESIVVDRWMFRAMGHHRESCSQRQYERMADAIRIVARETEEAPSALQAIVWVAIQSNNIKGN